MEKTNKETIIEATAVEVVPAQENAPTTGKGKVILDKAKKFGKKAAPIVGAFALGVLATVLGTKLSAKKGNVSDAGDDACDYGVEEEEFDYPMEDPAEEE